MLRIACCVVLCPLSSHLVVFGSENCLWCVIKGDKVDANEQVTDLAGDGDLRLVSKTSRHLIFVLGIGIVKDNGDAGFSDACLTAFVDEILLCLRSHL